MIEQNNEAHRRIYTEQFAHLENSPEISEVNSININEDIRNIKPYNLRSKKMVDA